MSDSTLLSPWIRRFLIEYCVTERNFARSTQLSYRDTFARLIRYTAAATRQRADRLALADISRGRVVDFLYEASAQQHCGPRTLNQKLAAVHSFARFVGAYAPECLAWSGELLSIPFKKYPRPTLPYLEKSEMDALLGAPDRRTAQGERDYALLLFLYNTGARASEAAALCVKDLQLPGQSGETPGLVTLRGKGDKTRLCPLWAHTAHAIKSLVEERESAERVFLNRCGRSITRFGIHAVVERYAKRLAPRFPAFARKRVSPHTLRHSTATHLLRAGVDINTIRAWLGHVSLATTNVYAQIDLQMKQRALETLSPRGNPVRRRHVEPDLLQFLRSL